MTEESTSGQAAEQEPKPLHEAIAQKVRANSRTEGQPTKLEIVGADDNLLPGEDVVAILEDMKASPRYGDVAHIVLKNGEVHVYSRRFVTDRYAQLCALVLAGDTPAMIAAVVREESEIYPRATPWKSFYDPPYSMIEGDMEQALATMAADLDYRDIHKIVASTGAAYLYSDRFIKYDQAVSMVEWEEVGRHQNP